MSIKEIYERWLEHANDEIKEELRGYSEKEVEDVYCTIKIPKGWEGINN